MNTSHQPEPGGDRDSEAVDPQEHESQPDDESETASAGESAAADEPDDDELPEWEPLTPELVEDEAIRGDFMLRWAAVLLAFLLACTQVAETRALVRIKTGQYMAAHGFLPPAQDVFSNTAAERPWVNLSWLFDALVAGVYGIGGATALSLFKALLAAVTFGLLIHTTRPRVSSWWGTICAVIAMLACTLQLTVGPELVTLLGLAVTIWWLHRWREGMSAHLWPLLGLFFIWSNLDPRMFLGLALLLLYAIGEEVGRLISRPSLEEPQLRKHLWLVIGGCCAVSLLNPFGWNALLAPITLYGHRVSGIARNITRRRSIR